MPCWTTYAGQTFSTLGVAPGTYKWTRGSGADADSFMLDIVAAAAAPEPCSLYCWRWRCRWEKDQIKK